MNIMVIAGYDVLADKSRDHIEYARECFKRVIEEDINIVFVVGGATNPDYPNLTEAETNEKIVRYLRDMAHLNGHSDKVISNIHVISLPVGNTSAETLEAVKEFLEGQKIPINKLFVCAEQSRLTGFLLDALYVGLMDPSEDLPKQIIAYGHPFPDSQKEFIAQRKKMLMKVLSHYGFPFSVIRRIYQKIHQIRVARIKRRQIKSPRES